MNLLLKIINNPKETISSLSHEFKKESGTIGRDSNSSWVLADKAKEVSALHLEVEYRNGKYFMIDLSTNGTIYKRENRRVAPGELVSFVEGDVLSIGPFDVLVGFVKSQSKARGIDDFLNKREIDIALEEKLITKKQKSSPLDIILKERVEDKDILEFANIKPNKNLNGTDMFLEDAFSDLESESTLNNAYTTHITPPTFETEDLEDAPSTQTTSSENLLQSIFASKLGLNLSNLKEEQQVALVSELAESILMNLEEVEKLKNNIETIEKKLEKPNVKIDTKTIKDSKVLLKERLYGKQGGTLCKTLKKDFEKISMRHTALYEASKTQSEELEHEFAPNTLSQEFKVSSMFGQDAKNWRAYVEKYTYLNEITASKGFQARLFKNYQAVMEVFKLSKGSK